MHQSTFLKRYWLFLLFLSPFTPNWSQYPVLPLDDWIEHLSAEYPQDTFPLDRVVPILKDSGSQLKCQSLAYMERLGPMNLDRYKIRMTLLKAIMAIVHPVCNPADDHDAWVQEALRKTIEKGDDRLLYEVYIYMCTYYHNLSKFGASSLYGLLAMDLWNQRPQEDLLFHPHTFYNIGCNFYQTGEYRLALKSGIQALSPPKKEKTGDSELIDSSLQMYSWNLVGLAYEELGIYDSAFYAFDKALELASHLKKPFWQGLIQGNRGDIFYLQGKYDSASVLLHQDYKLSLSSENFENAANTLQRLALIESFRGNAGEALNMVRTSDRLLNQWGFHPKYRERILDTYVKVFTKLNKPDSAQAYMQKYLVLHDSLLRIQFEGKSDIVNMRLAFQNNLHDIEDLSKDKKRIALIRNFIILFILLLSITIVLYLNRQRLKLRLSQQQALEAKRLAETEMKQAQEKLDLLTERLLERNSLVENLQSQMSTKELTDSQVQHIQALTQHTILTDDDWNDFRELFDKVYPGFLRSLRERFPEITLAEIRMAALCRLKLSPKEAGTLLGISASSVNKTRQRLRQRLGVNAETELESYFAHFQIVAA